MVSLILYRVVVTQDVRLDFLQVHMEVMEIVGIHIRGNMLSEDSKGVCESGNLCRRWVCLCIT